MQQVHQIQHNYTNEILSLWTHEASDDVQVTDGKDDSLNETNAHEERDEEGRHGRMRGKVLSGIQARKHLMYVMTMLGVPNNAQHNVHQHRQILSEQVHLYKAHLLCIVADG